MKTKETTQVRRMGLALLAAASALLLTTGLSLLLSRSQALAQPAAEIVASELHVQKSVNTTQAAPGDTLTYTIHVWRTGVGAPVYGAWLTDTLVDELEFIPGTHTLAASHGDVGYQDGVITWTGDLGDALITFSVLISPEIGQTTIANTAELTGTGLTTHSVATEVKPGEVQASKFVAPSSAHTDEQLAYTIRVSNTGYTAVTARMTDELPSEVNYDGGLGATGGNWGVAGNLITWTGSVTPLEAVTISFTARITSELSEDTSFTNTAVISGAGSVLSRSIEATGTTAVLQCLPVVLRDFLPGPPDLDPIPSPDGNGVYTVTWQPFAEFDYYVLRESGVVNFGSYTEYQLTVPYKVFTKTSPYDAWHYRVRASGQYWGPEDWSNMESYGFYDNFNYSNTGWPDDEGKMYYDDDEGKWKYWRRGYKTSSDEYRIWIDQGGAYSWFYQPDALAPYKPATNRYCVETKIRFERRGYWANMGLIFGADDDNKDIYAVCMSYAHDEVGWFVMRNDGYKFPKKACFGEKFKQGGSHTSVNGWNRIRVSVNGNAVKVYLRADGESEWHRVFNDTMSGLAGKRRVGVVGGDYEVTPIDVRVDSFKVIPDSGCP